MNKRKVLIQREVLEIASQVGIKNFTRQSLGYYIRTGVFPPPIASAENNMTWFNADQALCGIIDVSKRKQPPVEISWDDLELAKDAVLESSRAKTVSMMLRKITQQRDDFD